MVRTLNNGRNIARAFLSERYRPLDNWDLFNAIATPLRNAGCVIRSAEITETRFYIQASTPRIQRPIAQKIRLAGGEQKIVRVVEAGVIIGNSEVGCGSIFADPIIFDQWCTNGAVMQRTLKRHHVGRRNEGELWGDEATMELFTDETRKLDDKAFWAKVADVAAASMNETRFNEYVDKLVGTQNIEIKAKPAEVVELVGQKYALSENEQEAILAYYLEGGDRTGFGFLQAVTRSAEDAENYDRAVDLERLGPIVLLDDHELVRAMQKG